MKLEEYFNILPYKIIITNNAKSTYRKLNRHNDLAVIYGHCYNGKWYIGQTVDYDNLNRRFGTDGNRYLLKNQYGDYSHPKFARAITKYCWENFQHYILGFYTKDKINKAEIYWIKRKDAYNNGYNSDTGGQHAKEKLPQNKKISNAMHGHIVSDETKKKISNSLKNSKARPDLSKYWFKPGQDNPMYGKDVNYIENLGGAKSCAENFFYGKTHDDETKKMLSKKATDRKLSQETKDKIKKIAKESSENLSKERLEHPERFIGRCKPVAMLDKNGNVLKTFISASAAQKETGISRILISKCANRKAYTAGTYRWKYILAKEVKNDI